MLASDAITPSLVWRQMLVGCERRERRVTIPVCELQRLWDFVEEAHSCIKSMLNTSGENFIAAWPALFILHSISENR